VAEYLSTVPQVLQEAEDQPTSTKSHSSEFDTSELGDGIMLLFDDNVQNVIDTNGGLTCCYYAVDPLFSMSELVTNNGDENVSDSNVHIVVSELEGLVEFSTCNQTNYSQPNQG